MANERDRDNAKEVQQIKDSDFAKNQKKNDQETSDRASNQGGTGSHKK